MGNLYVYCTSSPRPSRLPAMAQSYVGKRDNLGDIFLPVPIMGGEKGGEPGSGRQSERDMLRARKHANGHGAHDRHLSAILNNAPLFTPCFSCCRALTKDIDIGLSIQRIEDDVIEEFLIQGGAVSPIVTIEPRRRKFHKGRTKDFLTGTLYSNH